MIIDKLYESVEKKGNVCVGLDTDIEYIPQYFKSKFKTEEDMIFNFNKEIIDATFDISACYKVQIAYYEALGIRGMMAYKKTLDYIREKKSLIIADVKRGDIANTAKMYAKAHFEGDFEADFITLNPYMGMDSIEPYLTYVKNNNKGLFALIRTSNDGAKDIEYISTREEKKIYDVVGEKVNSIGDNFVGKHGYSSIGGVVGCTHTDEAIQIRRNLNKMFFLIPGYGAQGGKAKDVATYLNKGNGGIVNSSRGILLAYKQYDDERHFAECSRKEVQRMRDDILMAVNTL